MCVCHCARKKPVMLCQLLYLVFFYLKTLNKQIEIYDINDNITDEVAKKPNGAANYIQVLSVILFASVLCCCGVVTVGN